MEDVEDFFISMGWQISDGPEVETEWYDFDALNFGPDHPARQMQDTFYVKGNQAKDAARIRRIQHGAAHPDLLRSGACLLTRGVPLYIACPGRVFRTDELDATHTPVFHQVEALAVDKHLTMADLKGVSISLPWPCSARKPRPVCVRATSRSPSRAPNSTCGSLTRRVAQAGSNGAAAVWSTRMC